MEGLCELSPIQDVWIDGVHHVEVIGGICRVIYFKWKQLDGVWRPVAIEFATVRPMSAVCLELQKWGVPILELSSNLRKAGAHH